MYVRKISYCFVGGRVWLRVRHDSLLVDFSLHSWCISLLLRSLFSWIVVVVSMVKMRDRGYFNVENQSCKCPFKISRTKLT